jgi:hypothetical protein
MNQKLAWHTTSSFRTEVNHNKDDIIPNKGELVLDVDRDALNKDEPERRNLPRMGLSQTGRSGTEQKQNQK